MRKGKKKLKKPNKEQSKVVLYGEKNGSLLVCC